MLPAQFVRPVGPRATTSALGLVPFGHRDANLTRGSGALGLGWANDVMAWRKAVARLRRRQPGVRPIDPVVGEVRRQRLTYLPVGALNDLYVAAKQAERSKRPGVFLEAGCALGGSAIVLAKAKSKQRPLFVHDVFGMIPPPNDDDGADVHERYEKIKS